MTEASEQRSQDKKDEVAENIKPEVLRTYAFLIERILPNLVTGTLTPAFAPEVYIAAIIALRFQADAMERGVEY